MCNSIDLVMAEHSDLDGVSLDLPTPHCGHPSEEGIYPPCPFGHPSKEGIYPDCSGGQPSQEEICRREVIGYAKHLRELARKLRNNMTLGEVLLWQRLKRKQMRGYDFDRQRPIDRYIVDFYCKDLKLAIEIDGSSHDGEEAKVNDRIRQERLESLGVRFLRFNDRDVKQNIEMVVNAIEHWIDDRDRM
jgi:very-short-patch-repair endonuclease